MLDTASDAAEGVWDVMARCGSQLRVGGLGTPFALDYGAVMLVGYARGIDTGLLAELLPIAEQAILSAGAADTMDEGEAEA